MLPEDTADGLLACTRRALLHRLATGQAQGRAPSMIAAVVRDGRPAWVQGRGLVDGRPPSADVAYRIGSLTKTFAAVLVLRLRDEGRLALSDPIDKHLPGVGAGAANIAQLLAHVGGLAAEPPGPWWERTPGSLRPELSDVLGDQPVAHPDGVRFHYSNLGYALVGALVERLRGRPWADVLRDEVLDPLGMVATGVRPSGAYARGWATHPWADVLLTEPTEDYGRMTPAGQLWSTAADLCRWAAFLAAGDDRVLSAETVAEMRIPSAPPEIGSQGAGYGLGLQVLQHEGRTLVGHTGSVPGFIAALWVSPADGVGAVALANVTSGPPIGKIAAELLQIVADREPRTPPAWAPLTDAGPDLLDLVGPWYWGPAPMVLRLRAGRVLELGSLTGSGLSSRLLPGPDGTWVGQSGYFAGETLRVMRDADGAITHLDLGTFVLTRAPYDPGAAVPGGVDQAGWGAPDDRTQPAGDGEQ
jgi:CubicO group peptidase (beta-lactamase class C family)